VREPLTQAGADLAPSPQDADTARVSRGVVPPSLCHWRALLAVAGVALLAVALVLLGYAGSLSSRRVGIVLGYGEALGLFCALTLCLSRAWVRRLPTRDAWLLAWLVLFVAAIAFSYVAGVVGTVLGYGPGRDLLALFMLKSVAAVGIVSAGLLRYLYIRAQWREEILAESEARVHALQARIHPHFLFNSLNTIASLVAGDPDGAERAIEDLADLFRAGMRRADQLIRLDEELELARKYVEMEQRRLGHRLQVDWQVDELPGSALVLPMILQPLLENAINHGVQPRPDGGQVRLYGRAEGGSVVITVSNPLAAAGPRPGHGMALHNIRSRLDLAFGPRAGLLTNQDGDRFYAVLTLPND